MSYYVGIDPGNEGAIAIVSDGGVQVYEMPFNKKTKVLDTLQILHMLEPGCVIAIEDVHAIPLWGAKGSFNFGYNYGKIRCILEMISANHMVIKPKVWKDTILAGTAKDKEAAILYTQRLYPNAYICPNGSPAILWKDYKLKRNMDGIADAICMALYAKEKMR